MDPGRDFVTKSDLRAGLSELELRLRVWGDERFSGCASKENVAAIERRFEAWCSRLDNKIIDEGKIRDLAQTTFEKEHTDQWTGRNRVITVVLFIGSVATTITTFVLLLLNAT